MTMKGPSAMIRTIAAIACLLFSGIALAADSTITNLPAASALDGTELLAGVQGGASKKITGNQLKTLIAPTAANPSATASDTAVNGSSLNFMRADGAPAIQKATNAQFGLAKGDGLTINCVAGVCAAATVTSVSAGCGTSTGGSPITATGTVASALTLRSNTAASDTLVSTDCGNAVYENRATSVAVAIAQAGTTGFGAGTFFLVCNINAGTATITPTTSTIGGASTLAITAGTAAAPNCVNFQSDGTNYNLLNAQATGGGGTPGGSSGQLQYNNAGAFGGAEFWRNAAGVFWLANTTNPTALFAYNTTDSNTSPTNYERGGFDWTTTANTLTIGTQKGGTGTGRSIAFVSVQSAASMAFSFTNNSQTTFVGPDASNGGWVIGGSSGQPDAWWAPNVGAGYGWRLRQDAEYGWVNGTNAIAGPDTALSRTAAGVVDINGGTRGAHDGWFNYGGQARVASDVTFTSTTTLATVTGLTVNVAAGRTYHFEADLSYTDAAAGGIQAAISGTATATAIIYDGWIVDSGANGIKGNAQATALGSAVASATTTGTAGHVKVSGTITVNAAGTLLVQSAQNTSNGTATTVKRGSTFIVQDMP